MQWAVTKAIGNDVAAIVRVALVIGCVLSVACGGRDSVDLITVRAAAAGKIAATQRVEWPLELRPGQTLLIEAHQEQFNFIVTLTGPDGKALHSIDSPGERIGTERLLYRTQQAGIYKVAIFGHEHPQAIGGYRVEFNVVPDGAPARLLEGYRAMTAAAEHFAAGRVDEREQVATLYERAAKDFAAAARPELEADARYALAALSYEPLADWSAAAANAGQSALIYKTLANERRYADSIALEAAALTERGKAKGRGDSASAEADLDRAASLLHAAVKINLAQKNDFALAHNYNDLGLNLLYRDEFEPAVASFKQAVSIFARLKERPDELMSLQDIATVQALRGDYRAAANELERLLGEMDPKADPGAVADVVANSAFALAQIGDTSAALARYARALDVQESDGDVGGQARSRQGIANIYWRLGERDRALEMFLATLPLRELANDHRGFVITLVSIGNLYRELGQLTQAANFHSRALEYATQNDMSATDRMRVQIALAADKNAAGDHAGAMIIVDAVSQLDVPRDHPFQARALLERARASAGMGKLDVAIGNLQQAIAMQAAIGASFEESMARVMLAELLHKQQRDAESLAELDKALAQLESLRVQAAGPELRAAFLAARHEAYGQRVDVLLANRETTANDAIVESLLTAERSHARSFLDGLHSRHEMRSTDQTANDQIAKLYEQLDGHQLRLQLLIAQGLAPTDRRMIGMKAEINLLRAKLDSQSSRRSSAATFEDVSSRAQLRALQSKLHPGDVVLNYLLSTPKSWLWVMTREQIRVLPLADRAVIEKAATGFLASLSRPSSIDAKLIDSGKVLARHILWPAGLTDEMKRTIVIADGVLQHVPFSSLPTNASANADRLVDRTELTTAYSLSTLQLLEQHRRAPVANPRLLLVADPVFSAEDARASALRVGPAINTFVANNRRGGDKVLSHLDVPRLPATGVEAQAIARLMPDDRVHLAAGFAANQHVFDEVGQGNYSILHFATHIRVDRDDPGLTSLLLSKLDEKGKSVRSAVAAYEIAAMQLQPELVVLSACDSSVGRDFRGEGMLGLGRAFLMSGAQNVIATQWPIADRATSELMQSLYAALIQQGATPSAALRSAQVSMKKDKRWAHPYYWAGFVVYGSPGF